MLKNELIIILYITKSGFNTLISNIKMMWHVKILLKYFLIQKHYEMFKKYECKMYPYYLVYSSIYRNNYNWKGGEIRAFF